MRSLNEHVHSFIAWNPGAKMRKIDDAVRRGRADHSQRDTDRALQELRKDGAIHYVSAKTRANNDITPGWYDASSYNDDGTRTR